MLKMLFENIAEMSLSACIAIILVLLVRLVLLRSPRKFCYALWLAVLIRLLCPVTFTAQVEVEPEQLDSELVAMWAEYSAEEDWPASSDASMQENSSAWDVRDLLSGIWLLGVVCMMIYCGASMLLLRRKLSAAVPLEGNVYIADHIGAPFVVGLLRPKIFMPSDLARGEWDYILAHERHHICRGDHFAKLLAFAALTLHWFNPLVWLAFRLFVKDMEASCDEAVLAKLGESVRADYSQSLLDLAVGRRIPAWTPLAFGEDTKGRIENVLRWKKPGLHRVLTAALVTAVCIGCCFVSVEGVMVEEEQPSGSLRLAEMGIQPDELLSGSIVRSYDPLNRVELSQGQLDTVAALLEKVKYTEIGQETSGAVGLFTIKLEQSGKRYCQLSFGYEGGERCLTLDDRSVDNEALMAYVYHIYLSGGCIDYSTTMLPDGAQLAGNEHGVRIYEYWCEDCGQWEKGAQSQQCSCCELGDHYERYQRLGHPGG